MKAKTEPKNVKVLFMARKFPPSVGGMERFAYELSEAISKKVHLHKIKWGGSNKWLFIVLPIFFVRAFFQLLFNKYDIIHAQDAVQAPVAWLLHVIFQKPYLVVAHGLDITHNRSFYQKLIIPFVRKADAVVSISSATKEEAAKRRVNRSKLHIITLGVNDDYSEISFKNKEIVSDILNEDVSKKTLLLTTGRLIKRKGVAWFVDDVLPRLVADNKELLYIIVGEGEERASIEGSIAKNSMQSYTRMLGRVNDAQRKALYLGSDMFIMPNVHVPGDIEGFGLVAHEAATAGLTVIASKLEGILDAIVDGKNGVLVNWADSEAYISQINYYLKHPNERRAFGENARKYTLKNYSWSKIADEYIELYYKLI
jgi:phosphatidylinositol alpha-1,6-mannosyltransferase